MDGLHPVTILPEVHKKIMFWVDECDKEISGFGKVVLENGAYTIVSAHLLKQEVDSTETEIDDEALAKLMYETIKEKGHLNFWWHSHVNMSVTWSSTDVATIKSIGGNGFCLATVFNKRRETRTAYYQGGTDFYPSIFVDDIDLEIGETITDNEAESWKKEMEDKVSYKKFKVGTPFNYHSFHGADNYFDDYMDDHLPAAMKVSNNYTIPNTWIKLPKEEKRAWKNAYTEWFGIGANLNLNDDKLIDFWRDSTESGWNLNDLLMDGD